MQKIYYDKINNKEMIDITGKKTLEQIKNEYGESNYQELIIDENIEGYRITDKTLEKYDLEAERQAELAEREAEKQVLIQKETALKTKLGLTTEEFEDFKKIIKKL